MVLVSESLKKMSSINRLECELTKKHAKKVIKLTLTLIVLQKGVTDCTAGVLTKLRRGGQ